MVFRVPPDDAGRGEFSCILNEMGQRYGHYGHLLNTRIACSSPSMVSGYMRLPSNCRIRSIDARYGHRLCASGLSHAWCAKVLVKRCSQTAPLSALLYSTKPPGCSISYGLMVTS